MLGTDTSSKNIFLKNINGFLVPSYKTDYSNIHSNKKEYIEATGLIPNSTSIESLKLLFLLMNSNGNKNIIHSIDLSELAPEICNKIIMAQIILVRFSLIVLEDPFKGLNTSAEVSEIKKFLYALRRLGKTILLTDQKSSEVYNLFEEANEIEFGKVMIVKSIEYPDDDNSLWAYNIKLFNKFHSYQFGHSQSFCHSTSFQNIST